MFSDPLQITYNSVTKDLVRINQDSGGSDYYLDDGTEKFSIAIRHIIPSRGGTGESHMIRLNVEEFDAEGSYLRTSSSWGVIKTFDGVQNADNAGYAADALAALLTPTNVGKLVQREN
jgi:hypothetical protein